jgi:cytochrome c2
MWNHGLAMQDAMRLAGVGWPTFSDSELADLIAFLYFLPFADSPGDPERGALVFEEKSCSTCHRGRVGEPESPNTGPALTGGSAASPSEFLAAMWTHAPVMKKAILREGLPWPELDGDDLRDLRSFLEAPDEAQ